MHSGRRCVACSAMTRGRPPRNSRWCSRSFVMLAALMLYLGRASVVSVGCQDAAANAARALMVQGSGSGSQAMAQAAAGDGARIEVRPAGIGFEVIAHCAVVADPWGIVPRMVTGRAHGIWQERL